MPGKHKMPTIAFRPNSWWEYALIEERARLCGMNKKDFYTRSCIYGKICVVGSKENIQKIVDAVSELSITMREIVSQVEAGDFSLSGEGYEELKYDLLTLSVTVVDILDGAAYLFDKKPLEDTKHWKREVELEQLGKILKGS